jgi:acyl-CoA dehydrogenase
MSAIFKDRYKDHQEFTRSVRTFCEKELAPNLTRWEEEDFFPNDVFRKLGEQGFLGILLPEEFGGVDGDYRLAAAWCDAFGELCSVGMTVAVNMHSLVISHALAKYGSKESKARWMKGAVEGKLIGAYAFTEPGAGSDLANIRTQAKKAGDRWVINGSKTFITNGARADYVLVLARHDMKAGYKGFTTFVVDTKTPGFKVVRKLDKLGWRSSDTAELLFENVEVGSDCVLGVVGEGWAQASANLNWERMMLTLTSIAGARECIKASQRYAEDRKAFGKRLIDIPAVQEMLTEMRARLAIGDAFNARALDLLASGKPCRAEVSAAKRLVCDDAVWIADRAIQIHGGYGYTREFPVERWWRDLRLMPIGGGTSEIMAAIVAKELKWS